MPIYGCIHIIFYCGCMHVCTRKIIILFISIPDIHLTRSQFLYRSCSAPDHLTKTTCGLHVQDILSIESTCSKHVRILDVGGTNKPPLPKRKPGARVGKVGQALGSRIRSTKQTGSKVNYCLYVT